MRGVLPAAVALALATTGCMVGPDYRRPASPTPPTWGELSPATVSAEGPTPVSASHAVTDPPIAAWWTTFGDEQLTSLIARAVAGNLDVRQAEARIREARASRRIAAGALWPQIDGGGEYQHARSSGNGPGLPGARGHWGDLFQTGFDANWEIDVFGGLRREVEAADADIEAARAERDAVLVTLLGEVGSNYVTYRSLQQRIALAIRNLDAQQATLDLTRRLFTAGLAPELDVSRAEAQVATTASTIPALEEQAAQTVHRLSVLLGQPPMTLQDELQAVRPVPTPPSEVAVGLPSDLLLRRPDVARSERRLAAATAEIGVATRDLYPRFFITGVASLQSLKAEDLFDWQSRALSLGPNVTWALFRGGAVRANIDLKTATTEELLAAYDATVLQAFADVEDALVAFTHQQATRARLEEAVRANQRAAEVARKSYGQGLADFLIVLDAERSLFTSQDTLAQAERDVAVDLVALYKAVGGGWEAAAATVAAR